MCNVFAKYVLEIILRTINNVIYSPECRNAPKKSWKCYSKYEKTQIFSKENLILFDKALLIERKEVSLRSEIFVIIPTIIYINIR